MTGKISKARMEKKKATKKQINDKLARLIKQSNAEKAKIKHIKLSFSENRFGPLVFILLFAGVGGLLIFHSSAAPKPADTMPIADGMRQQSNAGGASMWIQPSTQKVTEGSMVTAEVWVDSRDEPVNAVEADLLYPMDKLAFDSIDVTNSAFGIEAQGDNANGRVTIARGSVTPVSGKQLVAKVTFKALAASGDAAVSVNDSSSVLRVKDNSNILGTRTGSNYTLTN